MIDEKTLLIDADGNDVRRMRLNGIPDIDDGNQVRSSEASKTRKVVIKKNRSASNGNDASMEGRVISGRYSIARKIGVGGMATVYEAHDSVLDRDVAIKMMHPQFTQSEAFVARFEQEAKSAAKLSNPNVVSVYDWGIDGDVYYIVMELLEGENLKTAIKENGVMSCANAAQVAIQVCSGLSAAHKCGIIHRDIKPQNIKLMPDHLLKIMDFGIARPQNSHLTSTNNVLGTAHYISPEQTRGLDVTPASDIYSLGVVMYECITGNVPFDGEDAITVALKQVQEAPVPPSELVDGIDPVFERIVLKCMAKNPNDRFQSAAELRDVLEAWLSGNVVDITVPESSYADMTVKLRRPYRDGYGSDDDEGNVSRKKPFVIAAIILGLILAIGGGAAAAIWSGVFSRAEKEPEVAVELVLVPDVVNHDMETAQKMLSDAGLSLGKVDERYDDNAAEGTILEQSVKAGSEVEAGSAVDVVASKGKTPAKTVVIPQGLVNMPQADVLARFKELGIEAITKTEHSDTIESGNVISTEPAGGTTVEVGSQVVVTVSEGVDLVSVPDVSGKSLVDARSAIEQAGFLVESENQHSDSVEAGHVISQYPEPGASAKRGTTVSLVVSLGEETVQMPALIGKTSQEAQNILIGLGLSYDIAGDSSLDGIVVSTYPQSGIIPRSTKVTLTVEAAPEESEPDEQGGEQQPSTPSDTSQ